ncbi:hypothetical protein K0M31_019869, partial [Melipona bicolor]
RRTRCSWAVNNGRRDQVASAALGRVGQEKIGGGIPGDPRPAYATNVIIFIRQRTVATVKFNSRETTAVRISLTRLALFPAGIHLFAGVPVPRNSASMSLYQTALLQNAAFNAVYKLRDNLRRLPRQHGRELAFSLPTP